jgi:hypothetical protein
MEGSIEHVEQKEGMYGPFRRVFVNDKWYSVFSNHNLLEGFVIQYDEKVVVGANGAQFFNAENIVVKSSVSQVSDKPVHHESYSDKTADIHLQVCLKIASDIAIAVYNKSVDGSGATAISPASIVKYAKTLQKEGWTE